MDRRSFLASLAALPLSSMAMAQSGPVTRIVFPFAAGGGGDTLCRLLAEALRSVMDRSFIVENRTGGDGLIGIKSVMSAAPDGTTVLITTGPTMYLLPMVETKPSFDLARDFVPVSHLARFEFAIVGGPAAEIKEFKELATWIKANPGKASYGVPSNGTIPHFTGSRLEQLLGVSMTRVPYRGGAPIIKDLMGGHLPLAVITLTDAITAHRSGTVRLLAVTSEQRSPFAPEVPTLKESGIDLVADAWYGMWLPAGSSKDFARQLSSAVAEVLKKDDVKDKMLKIGLIPVGSTPEGLDKELAANTMFWKPIVEATGYKITN
jgi:tripartite-type tricarboxylate transporter receptor subunit TctC